ncbi:L-threonylcarbamoyladenylate synthase [Engelhardtia mirabilis]|uniref:Threonylcarbamoyl-AMP synthase n=1 Tax=Engelhardtia mirabilis TaxID=2528011 RepID=A0A518BF37_9BACT|nr:Threonylcarbamoyl-AMP synthase [Planctomycetes bacterium Pla133]QDU99897.1 Threonylcarbamoyl-AMP synthase [Planctomycetes bacterium Pla86]
MAEVIEVGEGNGAEAIARAVEVLAGGGLVALPTETVYGLAACADDERAVARIFAAKGRPSHNPLIVHVPDVGAARAVAGTWPAAADRMARAFWPGPVTLVVPRGASVVAAVAAGGPTVALRAPASAITLAILRRLGRPVAAPSANRSQGVSPTRAEHVVSSLGARVDLVIDAGPCAVGLESAVVDVSREPARLLRPGTVDLEQLRAVLPELVPYDGAGDAQRSSPGQDRRHYAPAARLSLVESVDLADAARRAPGPTGLLLLDARPDLPVAWSQVLGRDPRHYASGLFAALWAADAAGCRSLIVELPPRSPAWSAVLDRLQRAAAPG